MTETQGNITIINSSKENVMATVVKYDQEKYSDIKPFSIKTGESKTWKRYPNRVYFSFMSEAKTLYGFLCRGGKNYEYLGQGKMALPDENNYYKLDFDIKNVKSHITVLSVLEDVAISIFKDVNNPIYEKKIKKNTSFSEKFDDDYYYLKISGDDIVYGVIPGISYYIAKGQVLVEVDTNIIKKPHKDADIQNELE
jgi:hypothetical protein